MSKNTYVRFSGANPFGSQAKLVMHHDRLHEYLSTGDTKSPIFMEVGLTDKCNMACVWCITELGRDNKKGKAIDIDVLEKYFKDFSRMGGKAITFAGQGEPTFYPHFERAVRAAKAAGLQLGMMTNGVFKNRYCQLIGENFEWIRVSLDTLNEENYKRWKFVDGVKTIRKNVATLGEYPVKVGINCNVGQEMSVEEVRDLVEWTTNTDDVTYMQFRPILPRFYKEEDAELNLEVWEYLDTQAIHPKINLSDDKRSDLRDGTAFSFRSCEGHFFEPILSATGEVKVCTYHPNDPNLSFGNIYDSSFEEIWKGKQRKEAIEYVRSLDYCSKCQMCCKLSEPNKLLDFLTHPEECVDINFL